MVSVLRHHFPQQTVDMGRVVPAHLLRRLDERQTDDLIDEGGDLLGALLHHTGHVLPFLHAVSQFGVGNDL